MKVIGFVSGMALGMAAAAAALTMAYPDVGKRMKRDGKNVWRGITRML